MLRGRGGRIAPPVGARVPDDMISTRMPSMRPLPTVVEITSDPRDLLWCDLPPHPLREGGRHRLLMAEGQDVPRHGNRHGCAGQPTNNQQPTTNNQKENEP